MNGGETERRIERYDGCNDARERRTGATDGSNGRLRRTAATADERLGYDGLYARSGTTRGTHALVTH